MAHGRKKYCPDGYYAFIPAPLPPPLTWSEDLVVALSHADLAIGKLAGEGLMWTSPHLLVPLFIRAEAVFSSRIEGTRTSVSELFSIEAGSPNIQPTMDFLEVSNYVAALEYGRRRLDSLPVSLRLVRELHARLMAGQKAKLVGPGEFRMIQNMIGSPGNTPQAASYIPPPPSDLPGCLDAWENFLHDDRLPPLIHIALVHAQFEAIHPFTDGNGRIGRLLISLLLLERQIIPSPLLYLSVYIDATRNQYIHRLQAITERGEWEEWLLYFLRGVRVQSDQAVGYIRSISGLFEEWRKQVKGDPAPTVEKALMLFAENPFWTVGKAAIKLNVAFATAQRAFARLQEKGIIAQVGQNRRNRQYCAWKVLAPLE